MKTRLIALGILLVGVSVVQASSITLFLSYPSQTTWQVSAIDSLGDNAGIDGVSFYVSGITSLNFANITAVFQDTSDANLTTYGFIDKLSKAGLNLANLDPSATNTFLIAQNPAIPAADIIYGVGQTSGNTNTLPPPPDTLLVGSVAYSVPTVFFSGARPADRQVILTDPSAATYLVAGNGVGGNLDIHPQITIVPEPSGFGMIAFGLICMVSAWHSRLASRFVIFSRSKLNQKWVLAFFIAVSVGIELRQSPSASAATITLTGSFPTSTTWQITASEASGDSAGIFGIGLSLQFGTAASTGNTIQFKGPTATFYDGMDIGDGSVQYGFTLKLGPIGTVTDALPHALTTSEGLSDPPGDYFYTVGSQGGSMATNTMDPGPPGAQGFSVLFSSSTYAAPVVLFSGTRLPNEPLHLTLPSAAVFKTVGGGAGANLNTTPNIVIGSLPEPSTMGLMLIALSEFAYVALTRRCRQTTLATSTRGVESRVGRTKKFFQHRLVLRGYKKAGPPRKCFLLIEMHKPRNICEEPGPHHHNLNIRSGS